MRVTVIQAIPSPQAVGLNIFSFTYYAAHNMPRLIAEMKLTTEDGDQA